MQDVDLVAASFAHVELLGELSVALHIFYASLYILLGLGNLALEDVLFVLRIQATTLVDFRLEILEDLLYRKIFQFGLSEASCLKVALNPQDEIVVDAHLHASIQGRL